MILLIHLFVAEVSSLAHLRHLLIHKQLHIVVLFSLEVTLQSVDLALKIVICLFHVVDLSAKELALLGKLLLGSELATKRVMKEGDD